MMLASVPPTELKFFYKTKLCVNRSDYYPAMEMNDNNAQARYGLRWRHVLGACTPTIAWYLHNIAFSIYQG